MGRAENKIAIVTGAARGLGAATATLLVREGAKVLLTDLRDDEGEALARELGRNALYQRHDVSRAEDWDRVMQTCTAAFGSPSVLVNNAGISFFKPLVDLAESDYRQIIDIDQVSVFLGMRAVVPSMKAVGGGSIINISSIAGLVGAPKVLPYVAAKFAVRDMSKAAAIELAPLNIRVNSVHPGFFDTPINARTPDNDAVLSSYTEAIPLGRIGRPEELAHMVLLLSTDEMTFATGAEFVIDGGVTCQ
ncbi:glucose 1-dehydrogenase [Rhodanobacter sp. A1T4]|uniref:glucose 1-dehydrogenase n=1 Tax=Rhodanobacter sp. A1T4 TaxID=2723087 RepID=UPI00160E38C6|nr:glucose 1-dehydrogenase [Rhodanobacter sp. A1T4]MBB6247871.1 3alpha(or 20beta)-hydroxysteroid dehydrogenase [Rhodanobacter sp. A1T4]